MFLLISTDFTLPLEIPPSSFILKYFGFESNPPFKRAAFTLNFKYRLRILYAQSFWVTLAPPVLPRLLAQVLPGLVFEIMSLSLLPSKSFTTNIAFITHTIELDQAFAHCLKFLTAAIRKSLDRVSVLVWLYILSDQLRIIGLGGYYSSNYLILRRLIIKRSLPFLSPRCKTDAESLFGILFQTLW